MSVRACLLSFSIATATLFAPGALAGERPLFQPEPAAPRRGELEAGAPFPDIELRDETNRPVHLADFRGQAVAITFFYSRCPTPTYCPLVSRNFDQTQALLQRLGSASHCHLLSLTLDPENDSSEVLAAYSKNYGADPHLWSFVSAPEKEVRRLGAAVGLQMQRKAGVLDHNLRTVVLDPQGRLWHVFRGESWTAAALVAELQAASRQHTSDASSPAPSPGAP